MDAIKHAMEYRDVKRIEQLNKLTDIETFWDDVRHLTKRINSCHSIRRWEILAENRYRELKKKG